VAALSIRELRDGRAEVAVAEQAGGLVVVRTLAPWTRAFSWGRTPLADDGVGVVERRTQADIDLVGPRTELRLRPGSEIVGSAMTPDGRSRFVSVRSDGAGPVPVRGLVVGLRVRRGG
jgi:hypothetical protein